MRSFHNSDILFTMITIIILTKDNQETLRKTLDSVQSFEEVLIVDTGSSDQTLIIAREYPNVTIHHAPLISFGDLRNEAAKKARFDWVFFIDSDEILSEELIQEIRKTKLDEHKVYAFSRLNFFNERPIRFCTWHPDIVLRLYHRKKSRFCNAKVHESLQTKGLKIHALHSPLYHTPYRTIDDFLKKMQLYSSLFASQNRSKKSSLSRAIFHAFFAFFKSYFLKRGFLGGKEGFIISLYNCHMAYYKYLKLWALNQKEQKKTPFVIDKERNGVSSPF